MEIHGDSFDYVLKGHDLNEKEIVDAIKKYNDDDIKIVSKYETWCHWCYGTWDGESKSRFCQFDDKYKGVRGGFPITVIDRAEYL